MSEWYLDCDDCTGGKWKTIAICINEAQIEQGSSHLGAQMAYISSFESDFCSMVWIRLRKWPSLGLFSEIDAFWLEGLKRLNPSAFFVFASLGCAFCSPVYHTQDFGMECGLLMIVIFVEMSSDRVGFYDNNNWYLPISLQKYRPQVKTQNT